MGKPTAAPPGRHLCEEQVTEPGTRTAEKSKGDLVICSLPAGTLPAPARPAQPWQQQKPERRRGGPGPGAQGCSAGAPRTPRGAAPSSQRTPGQLSIAWLAQGCVSRAESPIPLLFHAFFFCTFLNSLRSSPVPALPPAQSTQPPPELLIYKYLSGDILLVISARRVEMAAIQAPDEDRRYDD